MATAKVNTKKPKRNAKRVAVGRVDGGVIPGTPGMVKVARFLNVAQGEQFIKKISETDKKGVESGKYYLDVPESMQRRRTSAKK